MELGQLLQWVEVARPHVFVPADGIDGEADTKREPVKFGELTPVSQRECDRADVEAEIDQVDDATGTDLAWRRKAPIWFVICRQAHDGEGDGHR